MRASEALGSRVRWRPELLIGEPGEVIPKRAAELAADILVVGSRRRGALARLLEGSVSRAIVGRASVPVLIVPATRVSRPTASHHRAIELVRSANPGER
jgi:nucleotide-binding universal stress UspA family protein